MSNLTPDQIDAAIKAGIITPQQAREMRETDPPQTVTLSENAATIGNEDDLRFIRGFSDIFIALGVGLITLGIWGFTAMSGGGVDYLLAALVVAIMAEYFGRHKRIHLPTLLCAIAFLFFMQKGLVPFFAGLGLTNSLIVATINLAAMGLFYWRIRLPFCIALIAISLFYLLSAAVFTSVPDASIFHYGLVMMVAGVMTLAVAIFYDMKDMHRTTRFSDNAFWLHLTAAPLIIHGLMTTLLYMKADSAYQKLSLWKIDSGDAIALLVLIALISLIALAFNRRALIVSSLGYALLAVGFLLHKGGYGLGTTFTVSLLMLGASIVLLGVAWHEMRALILKVLPKSRVFPLPFDPNYKP